jgi:hypothetical protein
MDELIALVVKKTGIPEKTAKQAVEIVLKFLKDKLPSPIAEQIDTILEGGDISGITQGLGGLFGKKK